MPGGGQKVSFPHWSGAGKGWSCLASGGELMAGNVSPGEHPFWAGLRCCWICFYSWKVKKKSSKVTEPRGKCKCFLAVTQQTGPWICRMSYKIWGNLWAWPKGQEKVWKWHMRQVFGRVQALKMDGGEAGAAFLGCHLESKPLTSVPLSLPGPAGSHPMGFSDCFKIPTGALIPDPAASAMMVLSLPVQQRENSTFMMHSNTKLSPSELHKITLMLWPRQFSNRKFHGKFWNPKTPHFLESSGGK